MTPGILFKQRRLELGKSLEQISASTKIHIKILIALEEDQYGDLPARAFTRGFIVSYAKALGLNGNHIISQYHEFLEEKYAERKNRDKGHQGYVFEGKELEQNRRWLIFGASAAAIFAIAVLLVFKPQNHKRKEKHKEFTEEATTTQSNEEMSDLEGITPMNTSPSTASTGTSTSSVINSSTTTSIMAVVSISSSKSSSASTSPTSAMIAASPTLSPSPSLLSKSTATPTFVTTPARLQLRHMQRYLHFLRHRLRQQHQHLLQRHHLRQHPKIN